MDYPLSKTNWICSHFGHWYGKPYQDRYGDDQETVRRTCQLCGTTIPPRS